ncbi:serine/threonine protein kinase, CMGC, dual-specificity, partial [Cryomyces antarcticus]
RHDETVPPVPAIPKAYESPKEQIEQLCLLSPQKISSYFADDETTGTAMRQHYGTIDTLTPEFTSTAGLSTDPPRARREYRHRRGLTVGTGSDADKTPATQHGDKKNLQPLRLPPLNLLPLSTPTAARIALFPAPSAEVDERRMTPPLERGLTKTPNTPMTASKATFFSKSRRDENDMSDNRNLRSSSSHNALRGAFDYSAFTDTANSSINMPMPAIANRNAITPFASGSLPKGSGEFGRIRSMPDDDYTLSSHDKGSYTPRINGPRAQLPKPAQDTSSSTSNEELETPSSGSSTRRKLSLGWRRSSSKASHTSQPAEEEGPPPPPPTHKDMGPPRHNGMPPPRLPASATWSGPMNGIHSSPASTSARPSFESGKRQNSTSALVSERDSAKVKTPRTGWTTVSHHPPISQDAASSAARSASSSILTPMHRMLGSKGSLGGLKARTPETGSDKDDLAADEEMRKLGSKRRDFETAAKELDELRKRA